jgi:hypothetical protein
MNKEEGDLFRAKQRLKYYSTKQQSVLGVQLFLFLLRLHYFFFFASNSSSYYIYSLFSALNNHKLDKFTLLTVN